MKKVRIYKCETKRAFDRVRTYAHRTKRNYKIKQKSLIVSLDEDFISKIKQDGINVIDAVECKDCIGETFYQNLILDK